MRISFNGNMDKVVRFVKKCEGFAEDIDVTAGRYIIDGKSIMGTTAICTMPKLEANIITCDPDRIAAFESAMMEFRSEEEMT